jgi:hypothetical protein
MPDTRKALRRTISVDFLQSRSSFKRARPALSIGLLWAAISTFTLADTLHDIGAGTYRHHDSGWTFPRQIGDFTRVGFPQDVDGTVDVAAHYERTTASGRLTAIIDVYPKDSSASQANYADAVKALRDQSPNNAQEIQQVLRIQRPAPLLAVKTFYETKAGSDTNPNATPGHSVLYFIDTGHWIVKIRTRTDRTNAASRSASDAFVLNQPWESLGLTKETCTGPACVTGNADAP